MIRSFENLDFRNMLDGIGLGFTTGDSNHDGRFDNADVQEAIVDIANAQCARPTANSDYQLATQPLSVGGMTYNDVHQGPLGDCYLLAGVAEVAIKHPEIFANMFVDNHDGTWGVRFFLVPPSNPPAEIHTTVDAQLPTSGVAGYDVETWVALAEKAYAQYHAAFYGAEDSYAAIEGGQPAAAIRELTGHDYPLGGSSKDPLATFETRYAAGQMICFGIGTHAYALQNYDGATQTATIYDPYGIVSTITWQQIVDTAVIQYVQ